MASTACVLHGSLNSVGGGERVALALLELLRDMGFDTTLVTTEPTDWDRVSRITGYNVRPDREYPVFPFRVRYFGIYTRMLTGYKLRKLRKRGLCDISVNTHGDIIPEEADITYMHFPTFALLETRYANEKYSKSLFWKLYFKPYAWIQRRMARRFKTRILLTNSEYSRQAIERYLGMSAEIVYPPVDIDEFLAVSDSTAREQRVVSCGRYTPEKRYEDVLRVASTLRGVEFTIMGAVSGKVSKPYIEKLREIKRRKGLDNVELLVDVPRDEQVGIYGRSKVFLHAMRGEHFGIAVVEAMASGLVPVVHMSGGSWNDILDRGRYGFGYTGRDITRAVLDALHLYYDYRRSVVERAKLYSKQVFKARMKSVIEEVSKQ